MLNGRLVGTEALILIFCFLLNGCVSYKEVKEMEVKSSTIVDNIDAEELSACVFELMKEEQPLDRLGGGMIIYHRNYDPIKKKWFIISELGSGSGYYNFSVSFQITGDKNSTNTEIRSLNTVWGNAQAPIERIFQLIKQCQNR
ncbi:MAG: hypothetical protein WAX77_02165 [Methylococcaceae bacterium]